jgi:preprotein translocase subunit YajC
MNYLSIIAMAQPQGADGGQGSMFQPLIFMGIIFFIFYFMMIRPQQKRQKERQKLLNEMKKGDKVITAGGIHGKIVALEDRTVLIEISDNLKIKVEKASIGTVLKDSETLSN